MPRFAANLSMLYPELDFLDRFEAAARDGFRAVEYLFPYAYEARELKARLDANGLQVDGWVKDVMNIEPIPEKIRAFGWTVVEVDGHDVQALAAAATQREADKPLLVVCRTNPIREVPSLEGRHQIHFIRFREGEAEAMNRDLGALEETHA